MIEEIIYDYTDIEKIYDANETFPGGFYPVGENNSWHGGIHLDGINSKINTICPIDNGEIIAYRLNEEYEEYSEQLDPYFDNIEIDEAIRTNPDKATIIRNLFKSVDESNKAFIMVDDDEQDKIKRSYDIENIEDFLKNIFNKYSNNFVLIRHIVRVNDNKIVYYSLYMHLLPCNHLPKYTDEIYRIENPNIIEEKGEIVRPFFREWIFTAKEGVLTNGLKMNTGNSVIPSWSHVTEIVKINRKGIEKQSSKIKVYSDVLNNNGFVNPFFLEKVYDRIYVIPKRDNGIRLYYDVLKRDYKITVNDESIIEQFLTESIDEPEHETGMIKIKFHTENFKVNEVAGYLINISNEDFELYKSSNNESRIALKKDLYMYDLEEMAQSMDKDYTVRYLSPESKADYIRRNLFTFQIQDKKLHEKDILSIESITNPLIKKHFPEGAMKIKRIDTDRGLGSYKYTGWIDANELEIKNGGTYSVNGTEISKAAATGHPDIMMDNVQGVYVKEISDTASHTTKLSPGDKYKLNPPINRAEELESLDSYVNIVSEDGKNNIGYIKVRDLLSSSLEKRNSENFKINTSGNSVTVLSEENVIPVTTKTIIGFPGKYLCQNNIFHLETMMKDKIFLDIKETSEENISYLIKTGTYKYTENKTEKDIIPLRTGGLIKAIEESPNDSDVFKTQVLCEDMEEVWVKFSDINGKYNWINNPSGLKFTTDLGNLKTYTLSGDDYPKEAIETQGKIACAFYNETIDYVSLDNLRGGLSDKSRWYGDKAYWKLNIHIKKESASTGYIKRSEISEDFTVYGEKKEYFLLNRNGIEWYKNDPSIFNAGEEKDVTFEADTLIKKK